MYLRNHEEAWEENHNVDYFTIVVRIRRPAIKRKDTETASGIVVPPEYSIVLKFLTIFSNE